MDTDIPFIETEAVQTIINSIADAVIVADASRRIVFMNKAATTLWGYSLEELKGKTTECLYANVDDYERQGRIGYHVGAVPENPAFESRYSRKDGTEFTGESQVTQLRDKDGNVLGFLGIHKDITNRKQAEDNLRKSDERFRNIYNTAPLAFVIWDRNCIVSDWNKRAEKIFGWSKEEVVGRNFFEFLIPREARPKVEDIVKSLLQGNLPSYSINENLTKGGETILCEWNNSILYDKNDRVDAVISLALDITERKRAEQMLMESEEKFRLAFENATDAIIWANPETGIIVNCNKAAEALLEKKRSDIIGQHQRTIHPAEKAQYYEEVFRRHFEQKSTTDEEGEIITSTGRIIPVHITAAVTLVGNTPIIQGIFRDITHRKQAEEAIQKSTEEMKQLAYFVSHDLKNPAIAVHGLTKRFCNLYENMFDEKAKMYCSQILMSAEQIEALVQNINAYMSTKENPLHIETINLKDLIRIIKDEFNIQLNTHHVKLLEPGYAPEFRADRLSIIRVLRNLVDNAIKYGGENLRTIEIGYTDSPQFHIISVKDDGIGIAAKDSAGIFGLFKQIKKREAAEGTGLGLAIVKEIAERHKGKVWLESEGPKKGVTFYMSISKSL